MSLFGKMHRQLVFERRKTVLAEHLARLVPPGARVLDIGCGSGEVAKAVMDIRPDVAIDGIDVLVRPGTSIEVTEFDGRTIPFPDDSYDVAMTVDVLHHADDAGALLGEARRVATHSVLVKDHFRDGFLAEPTLKFMDWIGNAPYGVRLPYNYLSRREWHRLWERLELPIDAMVDRVPLYPYPFQWVFGRDLHFIASLAVQRLN